MPKAARITDKTKGHFNSEHGGHYTGKNHRPVHPSGAINGNISSGSNDVFINGLSAARKTDKVDERDVCTDGTGVIREGSSTVFINGKPAARVGDSIDPHTSGSDVIIGGSNNVFIGG